MQIHCLVFAFSIGPLVNGAANAWLGPRYLNWPSRVRGGEMEEERNVRPYLCSARDLNEVESLPDGKRRFLFVSLRDSIIF